MIKKFFLRNIPVLAINTLSFFAIFFVNLIISPILIREYGFSETTIAQSNILLVLGLAMGSIFTRYLLQFKIQYFLYITRLIMAMAVLQVIYIAQIMMTPLMPEIGMEYFFIPLRFIEGFSSGAVAFALSYLIGYKIVRNDFRGYIQGMITSQQYAIKFVAPLMAGALITYSHFPLAPYVIAMMVYVLIYIYMVKEGKALFRSYYRYICKRFKKPKLKFRYVKFSKVFDFKYLKTISEENRQDKKLDAWIVISQNSLRPIFDLYMVLCLTLYFHLSLIQAGFIISMMMLGMSGAFAVSYLYDRLYRRVGEYRVRYQSFPYIMLMFVFLIGFALAYYDVFALNEHDTFVYLSSLMLYLGLTRGLYSDWSNRKVFEYTSREGHLESFRGGLLFLSDVGHVLGYIILTTLYSFAQFEGVMSYMLFVCVMMLGIHIRFFSKRALRRRAEVVNLPVVSKEEAMALPAPEKDAA